MTVHYPTRARYQPIVRHRAGGTTPDYLPFMPRISVAGDLLITCLWRVCHITACARQHCLRILLPCDAQRRRYPFLTPSSHFLPLPRAPDEHRLSRACNARRMGAARTAGQRRGWMSLDVWDLPRRRSCLRRLATFRRGNIRALPYYHAIYARLPAATYHANTFRLAVRVLVTTHDMATNRKRRFTTALA